MDNKWHYTKDWDYPRLFGRYESMVAPAIPCVVVVNGHTLIRQWNVDYQCWDDEDGDDFFCKRDVVERWRYVDSLDMVTEDIAWEIYNLINRWKGGEYGVIPLQELLNKGWDEEI